MSAASVVWLKAFCHIITSLVIHVAIFENNLELNSQIFQSFHSIIHLDQTEIPPFNKGIVVREALDA